MLCYIFIAYVKEICYMKHYISHHPLHIIFPWCELCLITGLWCGYTRVCYILIHVFVFVKLKLFSGYFCVLESLFLTPGKQSSVTLECCVLRSSQFGPKLNMHYTFRAHRFHSSSLQPCTFPAIKDECDVDAVCLVYTLSCYKHTLCPHFSVLYLYCARHTSPCELLWTGTRMELISANPSVINNFWQPVGEAQG